MYSTPPSRGPSASASPTPSGHKALTDGISDGTKSDSMDASQSCDTDVESHADQVLSSSTALCVVGGAVANDERVATSEPWIGICTSEIANNLLAPMINEPEDPSEHYLPGESRSAFEARVDRETKMRRKPVA